MPTPHSRWFDQFHEGSQAPIFKLQMSEMKDFMISSLLLYGHVPGGAISDDEPFCQAFCSLSSHLSALKKGTFVRGGSY